MPKPVIDSMKAHLDLEAAMGGYEAEAHQIALCENFYAAVAKLLSARPNEIAFIENATRAWDMAFYSIPFRSGDRILTAVSEYASNYVAYLQLKKRVGVQIDVVPNDEVGQLSIKALENLIDERVKLISISHVPTNGGLVNPAAEVGKIARKAGILYLLDACQSVGQMSIDVNAIGCDMLSATGRKFLRGPRATGFLYVRKDVLEQLEPPLLDMHAAEWIAKDKYRIRADARRFENWEQNYAGKIGLGVAADYALSWGVDRIESRVQSLAELLRTELRKISGVTVRDLGQHQCAIVTFTLNNLDALQIKKKLSQNKINVTASTKPWTRIDMEERQLESVVRASVHYYNTEDEIEQFCQTLTKIVSAH